jgi:hypothetical protein
LTGLFVDTSKTYVEPPGSDQQGCPSGGGCVESFDTRISATPFYHNGFVYAAHVTGITNASAQFVPGLQWFRWRVTLDNSTGAIVSATEMEDAYLNASNNFTSLTFPVISATLDGDIMLGYDYMGDANHPSINFTSKRSTDPDNVMTGGLGIIAWASAVDTIDFRWGDYEAMSYNAPYQDFVWFASQYARTSDGDWATKIMRLKINFPRAADG